MIHLSQTPYSYRARRRQWAEESLCLGVCGKSGRYITEVWEVLKGLHYHDY